MKTTVSILLALILSIPAAAAARAGEVSDRIARAFAMVEAGLPAGEADAFRAVLRDGGADLALPLGQVLYTRRHFDKAAWFFGAAAAPGRVAAVGNLAATITDLNAGDPRRYPLELLELGHGLLVHAVAVAPEEAALWNDLGRAAHRLAEAGSRIPGLREMAVEAARTATELDPGEQLYWANLAEALAGAGDTEGAARALAHAHALDPVGPAFLYARGVVGASTASVPVDRPYCDVDYRCQEICPRSIIGQLGLVTCEMDNSSAQMACEAGEPYAPAYNCDEEFPEYGILIPGLNSGFSIRLPGFSMDVLVDGDGSVRTRVEGGVSAGPVGGYVRADGEWSPNGGVSVTNVGGGVRVSVLNGTPAGRMASDFGQSPVQIEAESVGGAEPTVGIEAYNRAIIAN